MALLAELVSMIYGSVAETWPFHLLKSEGEGKTIIKEGKYQYLGPWGHEVKKNYAFSNFKS